MAVHAPGAVIMVRPHHFEPNPQTANDNQFQAAPKSRIAISPVRLIGAEPTDELLRVANSNGMHISSGPVTKAGRIELLNYVREQALSVTLHRFGNLLGNPRKALTSK